MTDQLLLAIETSTPRASVALATMPPGPQIAIANQPPEETTACWLAPAAKQLLADRGATPADVGLVAVSCGPGSFTGLRLGVITGKTLAYALGAELIAVDTLEVLASQLPDSIDTAEVVIDAQRRQVYTARLQRDADRTWRRSGELAIVDDDAWLAALPAGATVTGPALSRLAKRLPDQVSAADRESWLPAAEAVARLAWQRYKQGQRDDFWQLVPRYVRRSAAEDKWDERHATSDRC